MSCEPMQASAAHGAATNAHGPLARFCMGAILRASYMQGQLQLVPHPPACAISPSVISAIAALKEPAMVLLLGDSVDRHLLDILCNHLGARRRSVGRYASSARDVGNIAPGSGMAYCRSGGNFVAAAIHNVGIVGPPYARYTAATLTPENDTLGSIPKQAAWAEEVHTGPPTVVVVHSYAWDYTSWWDSSNAPTVKAETWMDATMISTWAIRLDDYLRRLKRQFPNSLLLWRTAFTPFDRYFEGSWWRASPDGIAAMNVAARKVCASHGVAVLDTANTFARWLTEDGLHPHTPPSRAEERQNLAVWRQLVSVVRVARCERGSRGSRLRSCLEAIGPSGLAPTPARRSTVARGYCNKTEQGAKECSSSSPMASGSWKLQAASTKHAAVACLARCARCAACNFISFSAEHGDCSFFSRCDLSRLRQDVFAFHSAAVRDGKTVCSPSPCPWSKAITNRTFNDK